jgi:hypothetical protein
MTVRRTPAILALVALAAALASGRQWRRIDAMADANQRALAESLRARPHETNRPPADPSRRVAEAVERNEPLFEATLRLAGARRTAGWVCLASGAAALALGAWALRRSR